MATRLPLDVIVTVRLLGEPALWYWEIYDQRRNRVLANSWIEDATGYESKDTALAAGLKRASKWSVRPAVRLNGISLRAAQWQDRGLDRLRPGRWAVRRRRPSADGWFAVRRSLSAPG